MSLIGKVTRYMSEKLTSVEDEILLFQEGQVASKIATAYTFVPCAINVPIALYITPVTLGSTSANAVAFPAVPEVLSFTSLSAVSDLDAHAASVAYVVGNVVRATETGGTEAAYICNTAHTSTAGPDFDTDVANWTKLTHTTFLKLVHTSAGASKVANFNYKVEGYN